MSTALIDSLTSALLLCIHLAASPLLNMPYSAAFCCVWICGSPTGQIRLAQLNKTLLIIHWSHSDHTEPLYVLTVPRQALQCKVSAEETHTEMLKP